jgi:hypothetical protein
MGWRTGRRESVPIEEAACAKVQRCTEQMVCWGTRRDCTLLEQRINCVWGGAGVRQKGEEVSGRTQLPCAFAPSILQCW